MIAALNTLNPARVVDVCDGQNSIADPQGAESPDAPPQRQQSRAGKRKRAEREYRQHRGPACKTCSHPERLRIDRLLSSGASTAAVARQFGLNNATVFSFATPMRSRQLYGIGVT